MPANANSIIHYQDDCRSCDSRAADKLIKD